MPSGIGKYRYETDKGNIFFARTDDSPDLAVVRGLEPTSPLTESITFQVSKSTKQVGVKPRFCSLTLKGSDTVEGCLLNPKAAKKSVVILKKDHIPPIGQEINVNGRLWVIGSTSSEQMR